MNRNEATLKFQTQVRLTRHRERLWGHPYNNKAYIAATYVCTQIN